jgi:hypothetical protein
MTGCRHHTGVLLFLGGFLLLAPLTAWAQQPKPGGTLRVAWEADVAGFDPRLSPGAQAGYIMGNLFNRLVSIDAELNYVPDLAESWEILEDGKVYVFHLRQGVKFHSSCDAGSGTGTGIKSWAYPGRRSIPINCRAFSTLGPGTIPSTMTTSRSTP